VVAVVEARTTWVTIRSVKIQWDHTPYSDCFALDDEHQLLLALPPGKGKLEYQHCVIVVVRQEVKRSPQARASRKP
jgi:hypothetical protein